MGFPILFGTDFDNTIASYDHLFRESAGEMGVDISSNLTTKAEFRDYIRALPQGEIVWQKIQADVYGPRMLGAKLIDGFDAFVRCCRERSIPVFIISHKTEFAAQAPKVNLRLSALDWMAANGFFDRERIGLSRTQIFFEDTRKSKITRIQELGCTHFVDDMEEVLLDDEFPEGVVKILLSNKAEDKGFDDVLPFASWQEISDYLFC